MPSFCSDFFLLSHPLAPCPAVASLGVRVSRVADGALSLAYRLTGQLDRIRIPEPAPGFSDGLWQHSCFELFLGVPGNPAYREFNFSPSGQWAAYAFGDYRQPDPLFQPAQAPDMSIRRLADRLELDVLLPAALSPAPGSALEVGLSAVVEETNGRLGYWALIHPGSRPDFHRRDAWVQSLAAI